MAGQTEVFSQALKTIESQEQLAENIFQSETNISDLNSFGPEDLIKLIFRSIAPGTPDPTDKVITLIMGLKLATLNAGTLKITARGVTELINAKDQCEILFGPGPGENKTTSGFPGQRDGHSVCWVCGFSIAQLGEVLPNNNWVTLGASKQTAPNAPECEHIFPAGAAMIYLDIPNNIPNQGNFNELKINYEWSHKYCNGLKSAILFFDMFDANNNLIDPVPSKIFITNFLDKLLEPFSQGTPSCVMAALLKNRINVDAWKQHRIDFMMARVKIVTDFITQKRLTYKDPSQQITSGLYKQDLSNIFRNINFLYSKMMKSLILNKLNPVSVDSEISKVDFIDTQLGDLLNDFSDDPALGPIVRIAMENKKDKPYHSNFAEFMKQFISVAQSNPQDTRIPSLINEINTGLIRIFSDAQTQFIPLTGSQVIELLQSQIQLFLNDPQNVVIKQAFQQIGTGVAVDNPTLCSENGVLSGIILGHEYELACPGKPGRIGGKHHKTRKFNKKRNRKSKTYKN